MNESVKGLLFMVIVLANNLTSEARRRQNDSHDVYKAFEKCKSKMCAARVSFCVIMKDCGCGAVKEGEACDCCDDCFRCLGAKMWRKCCDCVGLCDQVSLNNTGNNHGIPSKSGDLPGQALPTLFEALSYVPHLPVSFMTRQRKGSLGKHGSSSHKHKCKVAFFDKCIAREDCLHSCSSMGAHRYRWFRNGCCQCIDQRCHDYGELQPHCKKCLAN